MVTMMYSSITNHRYLGTSTCLCTPMYAGL